MMFSSAAETATTKRKEKPSVSQSLPTEKFKKGAVIMREGDEPGAIYIVSKGRVQVTKSGKVLAEIGRDGIVGDMALIDNSPRSATVTALEDTECFVISLEEFNNILATSHPLLQAITKILTGRLRHMIATHTAH